MFAIVDVETTGSHASGNSMMEIAVAIHDGEKVVEEFSTLLNPNRYIPRNIRALTGITPEMVEDAPYFADVAEKVHKLLGDHIFVAHNVSFDLSFLQAAFSKFGFLFRPRCLCTVRYARKIRPGLRSYSLANLCKHFDVKNEAAHRALGDTRATAQIFSKLLELDRVNAWRELTKMNKGEFNLPANLPAWQYHKTPQKPGVYYFLDQAEKPLYIGKARNLKKRVASHFSTDKSSSRNQAFKREIYGIQYQLTGSELIAELLEDHEIRHYWPYYNHAQKRPKVKFGVYAFRDQKDRWRLGINKINRHQGFVAQFFSYNQAVEFSLSMADTYNLDRNLCGLPDMFQVGVTDPGEHNENFEEFLQKETLRHENLLLKTPGRKKGESGYIMLQKGQLKGYFFTRMDDPERHWKKILKWVKPLNSSITTDSILRRAKRLAEEQITVG